MVMETNKVAGPTTPESGGKDAVNKSPHFWRLPRGIPESAPPRSFRPQRRGRRIITRRHTYASDPTAHAP
jgi:hypothetical protein